MADGLAERTHLGSPLNAPGAAHDADAALPPRMAPAAGAPGPGRAGDVDEPEPSFPWSDLWQVPTILVSILLIVAGLVVAMHHRPQDDFSGALAHVERLIHDGRLEEAGRGLAEVIEPNLDLATVPQRARFHACVADWIALAQEAEGVDREENNLRTHDQYTRATDLGHDLTAEQIERWGHALISLDLLDEARRRLAELNILDRRAPGEGVREKQGRLFRRLVERMLGRPEFDASLVMELLDEYRADQRATLPDQAWAMARQAEVRLETGRPQQAIDRLLVDMRRVEHEAGAKGLDVSELYALLGRAYFDIGRFDQAIINLQRATEEPKANIAALALAHDLLGHVAASEADLERAFEHFDLVVREYVGTARHLSALLGRAEVFGALGDHEPARADYVLLAQLLARPADRHAITAVRVAASLINRHDSLLTRGDLPTALSYVKIAETLFDRNKVPVDVLLRVAMTSRQIADDIHADLSQETVSYDREQQVRLRHQANIHLRQAGEYFVRHARGVVALPGQDHDWALSLWNGADSYDLGGYHELAIAHFEEYLAGRSKNDPRRSEVLFRLAQCHQALQQYERAASHYERVIDEHPRSAVATASHVPLARCYVALDRKPEAERQLTQVLAGLLAVQPSAIDFRDALLELANLYYRARNHAAAIARFHEAVERYPDDPLRLETNFRLADSYRSLAVELAEQLRAPTPKTPGDRRRMEESRREYLVKARDLFGATAAGYAERDPARLEPHERDIERLAELYRADCTFFLGEYEAAIAIYDQAARRHADHHSSMHALVQIVNAYSAIGDTERARAAHRRALVRLGQLRDDAFNAPDALMDREAWERWLANAPVTAAHGGSAFDLHQ